MCQILERNGFIVVRQRGSHCVMQKRIGDTTLTVPVPLHDTVRRGALASIIRQSQLPRSVFEAAERPNAPKRRAPDSLPRQTETDESVRRIGNPTAIRNITYLMGAGLTKSLEESACVARSNDVELHRDDG